VRDGPLPPAGYASEERSRAAAFVKTLQFPRQRRFARMVVFSSRGVDAKCLSAHSLEIDRGARPAPREPDRLPTTGVEKYSDAHVMPLSILHVPGPFRSPRVTIERTAKSKLMVMLSRPKTRSPKGSARTLSFNQSDPRRLQKLEASGDALPLPPNRSANRTANDPMMQARATPFVACTVVETDSPSTGLPRRLPDGHAQAFRLTGQRNRSAPAVL
jgi:hypothetical protein